MVKTYMSDKRSDCLASSLALYVRVWKQNDKMNDWNREMSVALKDSCPATAMTDTIALPHLPFFRVQKSFGKRVKFDF